MNVVLIVADDLGFQAGCFGNPVIKTPNLDRLAKEGVWFPRAHCTTASCSASRSVLMTGMQNHSIGHYGHAHGSNHFSTYESVKSLPVLLAENGYRTCSIGKYHLAPEYVYHFDTYRNSGVQGNRNSVRMALNAKEWIAEDDERPFFLYFCSSDPHRGGGPDGFANHNEDPEHYPGITPVRYLPEDVIVPKWMNDTLVARKELAEYYQAISRLDQGLGVLFDALAELNHTDDTVVMFLSDNGPPWPGAKTNLYEPGSRLPLIVRHPNLKKPGSKNNALVMWTDIAPTIADLCGVGDFKAPILRPRENVGKLSTNGPKRPYRFHGRSFLPVLDEENPEGWNENYASHTFHEITMYFPMRMIMKGDYKYIFNIASPLPYPFASDLQSCPTWQEVLESNAEIYGQRSVYNYINRQRHELYDVKSDPHETKNLATDPQFQPLLKELQEKLQDYQEQTRDPWKSKWKYE
ncbi:sulfatase family protein [Thalassoroseus pseudoceratinae]|uniref:sulfatase family protein n=1 Tax=Thalassoroseus pseudoceratinae TaxID=2713176 RepID=UPI001F1018D2|nr:sulfatase [Thalassoroseus pseudoceratinae]